MGGEMAPGGTDIWYHGSWDGWQGWRSSGPAWSGHWNSHLGIHFAASYATAKEFAAGAFAGASLEQAWQGEVVGVQLKLARPLVMASEEELSQLAFRLAMAGRLAPVTYLERWSASWGKSWRELVAEPTVGQLELLDDLLNFGVGPVVAGETCKQYLLAAGYDGVIYGNGYETLGEKTAIAFHPWQIEVVEVFPMGDEEAAALGVVGAGRAS